MFKNKGIVNFTSISILISLFFIWIISSFLVSAASGIYTAPIKEETQTTTVIQPKIRVLNNNAITFPELTYYETFSTEICAIHLTDVNESINILKHSIETENYTEEAYNCITAELARLENVAIQLRSDLNLYATWEKENYYATKVWYFLRQRGYSEVVCSAIIGNMMVETAGGELCLNPTIYDSTKDYYGLCQWSVYYNPEVISMTFEEQLEYLEATLQKEFKTFSNCYYKGFTYENFINMTDPAEAALAFAKVYERCATWSYLPRTEAAVVAFNYFTSNN